MMANVLEVSGLSSGYGSVPVIVDVDLHVAAGEVVALLGANGAGKTTTLLSLSGELPPMAGEVRIEGRKETGPLYRRARRGLAYVPEERSVFRGISALDNLRAGGVEVSAALALFPELERCMSTRGGLLSGGEQQMLTLARALCRHPKLLLADELSLGLAPLIVQRLLAAVRRAANEDGCGVLLVEQHVRQALKYADRVYVMSRGRIDMELGADEARQRIDEIEETYMAGRATTSDVPESGPSAAPFVPAARADVTAEGRGTQGKE
jgi:branched-chain amino acid transport system ATP-binding protein